MNTSEIGILIVDDESSVRDSLYKWFLEDGYRVDTAADAKEALRKLQKQTWDIILLDIKMPGMSGLELQERIREIDPGIVIIIITAYASVDTAVTALKAGAFDYVTKPFDPDELEHLIRNAAEKRQLTRENLQLKEKIVQLNPEETIIAESPQMKHILELVDTVAQTDSTVLIHGESGTGKEVIARAIHNKSKRRLFPMIAVIFAVSAHCYNPWIKFKGGKGLAAAAGGSIFLFPQILVLWIIFWIALYLYKKNIQVANSFASLLTGLLVLATSDILNGFSTPPAKSVIFFETSIIFLFLIIISKHIFPLKEYFEEQSKKIRNREK